VLIQYLRIMASSLLFDKSAQMMTVDLLSSWMSITALQLTVFLVLLLKTSSNLHLLGEGSFMVHHTIFCQLLKQLYLEKT